MSWEHSELFGTLFVSLSLSRVACSEVSGGMGDSAHILG